MSGSNVYPYLNGQKMVTIHAAPSQMKRIRTYLADALERLADVVRPWDPPPIEPPTHFTPLWVNR